MLSVRKSGKCIQGALWLALSIQCGALYAQGVSTSPADWEKTLAAARKEGRVVLYGNFGPAIGNRLRADFEKAYPGVVLEVIRLPGTGVYVKFDQERKAQAIEVDVAVASDEMWARDRAKEKLFKAPAGPATPAWPRNY